MRAGGAGVFIDNSALAHGGQLWLEMAEDGSPDALTFAFVAIVRGKADVWTMGMHVLGLRDVVTKRQDVEADGFDIVEVIRYLSRGDNPVDDGHWKQDPATVLRTGLTRIVIPYPLLFRGYFLGSLAPTFGNFRGKSLWKPRCFASKPESKSRSRNCCKEKVRIPSTQCRPSTLPVES